MTTQPVQGGAIPPVEIRHRLRIAREHAHLDQGDLADRMGVARNTVSRAEAGAVAPRKIVVRMWALATGVDEHWLATGEAKNESSPPPNGDGLPEGGEPPAGFEPATFSLHGGQLVHFPRLAPAMSPGRDETQEEAA